MTHRRNCSLSRPCTPSAPPCCSWAACVCCVCECLQPVCKCLCVWANWIIFSGSGGEQEEERTFFFFFAGYLGVVDRRRTYPSVLSDCCWSFLESEGVWTWTGRKCHLCGKSHAWTRRVEFSFYCWWSGPFRSPQNYLLFVLGETVMTAEPVCVAVSLTSPCFWLGASNMLLFSNKWGAGIAHGGHAVYSCQDNSQAAAGLEFDLHTSARSAAGMVGRKCLWLRFTDSYGLFTGFFFFCSEEWCLKQKHVMCSVWEEHPDRHLK